MRNAFISKVSGPHLLTVHAAENRVHGNSHASIPQESWIDSLTLGRVMTCILRKGSVQLYTASFPP